MSGFLVWDDLSFRKVQDDENGRGQVGVAAQEGPSLGPLFKLETVALPNQVAARTAGLRERSLADFK